MASVYLAVVFGAIGRMLIVLTLQIQSGKCCALGEFLTKLWLAMQVQ